MSTREDITPWEFQTVPPSVFRSSPAASTGLVQDVTPWELYPVPTPAVPEPIPRKSKRSRRPSGSLAGLTLAGRSNKGKFSPPPSRKRPVQYSPQSPADSFSYHYTKASSTASFHTSPPMPLSSVFLGLKKTLSAPKIEPRQSASHDPRFSTVDRKILQELKHNISAREAQFVKKGRCPSFGANGVVAGKKHHPYSRRDVPYPRNYEREVLDLDVWETAFCHDACGTVTWHVFKTPPTRVLDLGCGTGSWILSCAKLWKDCHFVGLDIAPRILLLELLGFRQTCKYLLPSNSSVLTSLSLSLSLETLPFPDDEFDYVHVKRIALGVPEDKWDPLLEEITRVMKPGAAFELIEEDLFFPGKHVDSDCDTDLDDQVARPFAEDHQSSSEVMPTGADDEVSTPTTVTSMLLATPSRPSSPVPIREVAIAEMDEDVASLTRTRGSISSRGTPTPRPSLQVKTSHESWAQIQPPVVPKRSTSTLSLPTRQSVISPRQPNTSTSTAPATPIEASELLQTVSKPPINPRDHTILEMIYTEMLSSRFINQSPLSLLTNSLSLYFKDLRTHPAIQFTFPPLPPRKFRVFGKVEERQLLGEVEQKKPASDDEMYEYEDEVYERSRFLSMQSLLQHESPYVSLDETRPTAFAPSSLVNLHKSAREMKVAAIRRASRLPNGQLNLDLKTLNLHLALRVLEVLACAESMWEWVREEQRNIRSVEAVRLKGRSRSRRRTSLSSDVSGRFRERIADMTRDDFDDLTSNFRFDMQDQYMPGYALRDRFDWSISLCLPPPDRIAYDAACEKWRSWQEGQGTAAMPLHSTSAFTRPRVISSGNSSVSPPQIVRAHSGQSGQSGGSSTLVSPPPPPPPPSLSSVQGERWDQSLYRHDASHESLLVNPQTGRTRSLTHVSQVPPTSKMSRALKVFVGWKP
ncbi:hypothetical protein APHAL10511_002721 [Amanita phalloides]|nr:hypothetical protein APHAL10511_002721 [Amanita phalloides]